jgi:hypothetical protein
MYVPESNSNCNILFNTAILSVFSWHYLLKAVIKLQNVNSINDGRMSCINSKPISANYTLYARCIPNKILLLLLLLLLLSVTVDIMETAVAQWLRCCVTNRKVDGSIPAGVSGIFIAIKSFRSHYGPGVDSASNRNEYQEYFLGVKAAGA